MCLVEVVFIRGVCRSQSMLFPCQHSSFTCHCVFGIDVCDQCAFSVTRSVTYLSSPLGDSRPDHPGTLSRPLLYLRSLQGYRVHPDMVPRPLRALRVSSQGQSLLLRGTNAAMYVRRREYQAFRMQPKASPPFYPRLMVTHALLLRHVSPPGFQAHTELVVRAAFQPMGLPMNFRPYHFAANLSFQL